MIELTGPSLPRWPFTLAFAGLPVWWLLGVLDFVWIPMGIAMAFYMARAKHVYSPRWFGIWLLFLVWAALSISQLSGLGSVLVFGYRYAIYLACTVLLLYLFNNRTSLSDRYVTGVLTIWWLTTVVLGYVAMAFPTGTIRTPMSYLLPRSLMSNPWIAGMVIRSLNQYNPDSYFDLEPRPSAPYLYTNNWGNVYSLLIPFVVVYLMQVRGTKRFWILLAALVLSVVPAVATLNRGMFVGLGLAALYVVFRMALLGNLKVVVGGLVGLALGVGALQVSDTGDALGARLESGSTEDRATLYILAIEAAKDSPILGYGRTLDTSETNTRDPVGTQGQFWVVLISHGVGAVVAFVGWFAAAFLMSLYRRDPVGLVANTVLLVSIVELSYYGVVPYGLPLMMVASALALRGRVADGVRR